MDVLHGAKGKFPTRYYHSTMSCADDYVEAFAMTAVYGPQDSRGDVASPSGIVIWVEGDLAQHQKQASSSEYLSSATCVSCVLPLQRL